ncbi:MAG: prepilin-type N-terminal cleavage/methylation domain-containing protein [Oscillospiraceae bacterium]|nr:prepilin-type N-terminal cleavage/methylation domain-containing protein [Oscillospiraceae bacterium]
MSLKKVKQKVHQGFTLLEMIVVVAIIGILLLVAVPAVTGYYTNSRLNSANSDAKVVFNSLQTIMQEYEFAERSADESFFYGSSKTGTLLLMGDQGLIKKAYVGSATSNFASDAEIGAGSNPASATIGGRLIRLYPDYKTTAWCAYIENYRVYGVVAASASDSHYIGGYPLKAQFKDDADVTGSTTIANVDVSIMQGYKARAWS